MKVPLRWLGEFIELPTRDPDELSDALTMLGFEVEDVESLSAGWSEVYVGEILDIAPHPDADKIRVCQVDSGDGPTQIICGAWNFEPGATVAIARPGAVLPGDFEIGQREIRGVVSNGMICSESELGLGDDHDGILVLDPGFQVGKPFADQIELPDVVFEISITPNRPDAMSMLGLARDLGAHYGIGYRIPSIYWKPATGETEFGVSIEDPKGCSRFTIREITGVTVKPSPFRIRHRLRKAGVRPISNVVDATNYVMLELGQPLHAFDADKIVDKKLVVKRAKAGEALTTLDGVERELSPEDLIIYDGEGPASMSGTMGGSRSEVTASTTRVLMEAASWDPPTIMYMARRHDLRSEASSRFERGVDPNLTEAANQRVSALVADTSGGRVLEGAVDVIARPAKPARVELRLADVERLLGPGFTVEGVTAILRKLGMGVEGSDPLTVTVPTFRPDLTRPADLVEEVARIHGFDRFEPTLPTGPSGGLTAEQKRLRRLGETLVGAGLFQAINLPFVSVSELNGIGMNVRPQDLLTIKNPLREEESKLRPTLLPGLLRTSSYNLSHGAVSVGLFEIGSVFFTEPAAWDERLPEQYQRLGWVVFGDVGPRRLGHESAKADASVSLGIWRLVAQALGLESGLEPAEHPGFHPTRSASVTVGGAIIGHVGELSPLAGRQYDLPGRVAIGEIDLAPLLEPVPPARGMSPSVFPHVDFDLSFVVDREVGAGAVLAATEAAGGDLVESARVFDEFLGVDQGRKAIAVRYRIRSAERTLTGDDLAAVRMAMIEAAASLGAEVRGA